MTNTPKPEALASLVERLPVVADLLNRMGNGDMAEACTEAATTITTLAAERDALREILARLCDAYALVCEDTGKNYHQSPCSYYALARATLERTAQP